jgi:hypothetical protein
MLIFTNSYIVSFQKEHCLIFICDELGCFVGAIEIASRRVVLNNLFTECIKDSSHFLIHILPLESYLWSFVASRNLKESMLKLH